MLPFLSNLPRQTTPLIPKSSKLYTPYLSPVWPSHPPSTLRSTPRVLKNIPTSKPTAARLLSWRVGRNRGFRRSAIPAPKILIQCDFWRAWLRARLWCTRSCRKAWGSAPGEIAIWGLRCRSWLGFGVWGVRGSPSVVGTPSVGGWEIGEWGCGRCGC